MSSLLQLMNLCVIKVEILTKLLEIACKFQARAKLEL